jgi:outer membrane protein OmpA-like peptidoglycan-associated protein
MNSKALLTLLALLGYCSVGTWWWNNNKTCCITGDSSAVATSTTATTSNLPLAFNWDKNEVIQGEGFAAYRDEQTKNLGPTDTLLIKTWYYDGETNDEQIAMQRAEAIKALYPTVAPRFKVVAEKRTAEDKYKTEKFEAASFSVIANQKALVKKEGNKVIIYFATNAKNKQVEAEIDTYLNTLAADMKANANLKVTATGFTDNVGDDNKNLELSQNRAAFAKELLIQKGADANRINTSGKGEAEPAADNATEEGRKLNRRVEFIINQ